MAKIEIFHAGCKGCESTVRTVKRLASSSDEVHILSMKDAAVVRRAKRLGIQRFPAVLVNSKLAACCRLGGPKTTLLRQAGIGKD